MNVLGSRSLVALVQRTAVCSCQQRVCLTVAPLWWWRMWHVAATSAMRAWYYQWQQLTFALPRGKCLSCATIVGA